MSRQRTFKPSPAPTEQSHGRGHRVYTVAQLLRPELLNMARSTFFRLRSQLPYLVEVKPRSGRVIRYRADLVDRYLAGQWNRSRFFGSHVRQSAASTARRSTSFSEA